MPFAHAIALAAMTAFCGGALAQGDGGVRINQSRSLAPTTVTIPGLRQRGEACGSKRIPRSLPALTNRHPSLTSQLDAGVRQIEIDIFADTKGGLYAHPYGETLIAQADCRRILRLIPST